MVDVNLYTIRKMVLPKYLKI